MVTGRVSGFQPELGIDTVTRCSPMLRLIDIGVVLPVLTPSTITWAPEGNDVTFKTPLPDCARTPVEHTRTTARHKTYVFISVSLFCTSLLLASMVSARIAAVSTNPATHHFRKRL